MPKFLSLGKGQGGVLITLLILISLGACYFYIYLPNNEKTVQERRFRCLRKIDTNIRTKIQYSIKQIEALVDNYPKSKTYVNEYPTLYPTSGFTYLLPEEANKYFSNAKDKSSNDTSVKNSNSTTNKKTKNTRYSNLPNTANDTLIYIQGARNGTKFYIDVGSQFTLLGSKTNKKDKITIGMRFEFEQFIKPLLPSDVFDNYIVFFKNKRFYESFPSGFNFQDPDSLLDAKRNISSPGVRSLKIGGTNYKVFAHPIYSYTDDKWIIIGLVSDDSYQKEKNQLPVWALLLLLTTAVTILVLLPWIKLYNMGNQDRFTIVDAIESVLVSMMLMSLLFFIFFKYQAGLKDERLSHLNSAYSSNVLARKITSAFVEEIDAAGKLLRSFDEARVNGDTDVTLLGKEKTWKKGKKRKEPKANSLYIKYNALFEENPHKIDAMSIYWLDGTGMEKTELTIDANTSPKDSYTERNYFKNGKAKKYNRTGPDGFYIDQIISRPEGFFRSVIARNTGKDPLVLAMTFNIKSLDSVVMPDGYQFAIIDNYGRVLYHSSPNRDLNENLKDEFADSSKLVSSIEARSDTSFKAEYYGSLYNVKIKPISKLPYFTVIFEDTEYNDMRDSEAFTFTFSMLICLLFFQGIKYGVGFVVSSRPSFLRRQRFNISWIGPHKNSHHKYNLAIIANLFIILMLIIFFNFSSFLEYLYILLISIVFTSLYLGLIFYNECGYTDFCLHNFKKTAMVWLAAIVVLLTIVAYFNLNPEHFKILLCYEAILIFFYPFIFRIARAMLNKLRESKIKELLLWTYTHSYALMVTTRLIIACGIPAAFFYIYSFNYEQNLDTRFRQLNFAKQLDKKVDLTGKDTAVIVDTPGSTDKNQIYIPGIYFDGKIINSVNITTDKNLIRSLALSYKYEDLLTAKIFDAFRLRINNPEVKNNNLTMATVDSSAVFNKLNMKAGDGVPVETYYKIDTNKYIKISSQAHATYPPPGILTWLFLGLLGFLFYYVIHHIIRKLFALDLDHIRNWKKLDDKLLEDNEFNKQVFIIRSPGTDVLADLELDIRMQKIKDSAGKPLVLEDKDQLKKNVFVVDMMKISAEEGRFDAVWNAHKLDALTGHALVIINHFEYNIKNTRTNKVKLDLLEELKEQNAAKVIIISTIHPDIFLDPFDVQQPQDAIPEDELERWHTLLGAFHVVISPLMGFPFPDPTIMPENATNKPYEHPIIKFLKKWFIDGQTLQANPTGDNKMAILEETRYSPFLHSMRGMSLQQMYQEIIKLQPPINNQPPRNKRLDNESLMKFTDSLIFKFQFTSQYFFMDIWQSLTRREKFILYDLAEDGLVNSYDELNLSMLISKGLIIRDDGALKLFNKSFRNFILTAIGEKEMVRIKQQVKDSSKWKNLGAPLKLAILAILIFLFTSQQEAYSHVITYVTAFGAGIPTILKIFSMFGSGGTAAKKLE